MQNEKIQYPCQWEYRIIGIDEQEIQKAVFENINHTYTLRVANHSSKKKYISMHLITEVENEEKRNEIFQKLLKNPSIKMIL